MISNENYKEGQLLRIERLRQGKGIKEVAGNICSVSTLSKIERGKQSVDPEVLMKLYKGLGITYENDEKFVESMKTNIEQYFYEKLYDFELNSFINLNAENHRLLNSPLSLEWMIIQGLEEKNSIVEILDQCVDFMDEELRAWYYLIPRHESGEVALEKRIYAQKILQNSYGTLQLMWQYWGCGEYSKATHLAAQAVNYALEEGNISTLSQVYLIKGSIYACYNMEELMIEEYQKAVNLLKNTNWKQILDSVYYNIGATYISIGNYDKSRTYLKECREEYDDFYLSHKWAVLEIQSGNLEKANTWIEKMQDEIKNFEEENVLKDQWDKYHRDYYDEMNQILEITKLQAGGDLENAKEYIPLLESLIEKFFDEGRYGFMLFHKNSLKEAYINKRFYKKALELEEKVSLIATKNAFK